MATIKYQYKPDASLYTGLPALYLQWNNHVLRTLVALAILASTVYHLAASETSDGTLSLGIAHGIIAPSWASLCCKHCSRSSRFSPPKLQIAAFG